MTVHFVDKAPLILFDYAKAKKKKANSRPSPGGAKIKGHYRPCKRASVLSRLLLWRRILASNLKNRVNLVFIF